MTKWTYIESTSFSDYLKIKAQMHKARHLKQIDDIWLITSHSPGVFTYGRSFKDSSLLCSEEIISESGREIFELERGGDITYHGPSQIMIYPFMDVPDHDIEHLVRNLEKLAINILSDYNLEGVSLKGYPGIWCNDSKIASIGLAVRKWITMHGMSFNLDKDDGGFDMIIPCGIDGITMTSLSEQMDKKIDRLNFVELLIGHIENVFDVQLEKTDLDLFYNGYSRCD